MSTNARSLRSPTRAVAIAVQILAITGCIAPAPWQDSPSGDARNSASRATCPKIAGTYVNAASADTPCTGLDEEACRSLTFYLFSKHVREAAGVSNYPTPSDDWPWATHVRIEQPTADELRVVALDSNSGGQPQVRTSRELHRKDGDFDCVDDVIRLRPRVEYDFLLWIGRRTRSEYLTVSADRNALAVSSHRQYEGYYMWVIGGTMREEGSNLRWERLK